MTYSGINCRKKASCGKGKSMYSIIFNTASDLMYDLQSSSNKNHHTRSLLNDIHDNLPNFKKNMILN